MSESKEFAVPSLPTQKQQPQPPAQQPPSQDAPPQPPSQDAPPQPPSQDAPPQPPRKAPPLNYEKPSWSAQPSFKYSLEVLKNGATLETIQGPRKEFVTIGRLPLCDIPMEHPSISRYQAILQFDHDGDAYIYDMDSAHGTKVNKKPIPGREYVQLKPGDQIRFGESTRLCIFDSEKPYDPEAEAEEKRQIALRQRLAKARGEQQQEDEGEPEGVSWGFQEDAVEEDDDDEDDDGKENTRQDIEASLDASGDASLLNVEAEKMALEDAKRRREDLKIMYDDDSDEDLYDLTSRKKKKVEKADTHEDLVRKQKQAELDIAKLEKEIADKKAKEEAEKKRKDEEEDLDAYMTNLTKKSGKEKSLFVLQKELNQLRKDNTRLIKLVKLTKPSHIL